MIEPVGPMIWSTSAGVNVLTCIGRSNVTLNVLVGAVGDQVAAAGAARHRGARATCGPGTISGSVFWLNGGLRMRRGGSEKVTGDVGCGHGDRVDVARRQAR